MRAQKVPIGPKGEAQTRYFFSLQTTRGKGGGEPQRAADASGGASSWNVGMNLSNLSGSKMDENSLHESSKGSNWTQGCGYKPGIWSHSKPQGARGGQRAADASEGLPAGMWA